ncbi:MAG TPA: Gfo/Idh/MocA family oxidoreductase [Planctomycetota bacterium]|nr:Gfo/Idh/MocA family oxidoreductase [Planctomycetota bacterium]
MTATRKPVRIAAIGCGNHATNRVYPCFAKLEVDLVGVCDLDRGRAEANARRFGAAAAFTDAAAMLDATRPDGVVVCAGPQAHVAMALLALERRIPVYTEKPAAPTADEAWRVAQASRAAGTLAMTGFKYRYGRAMDKVMAIMAAPEFGPMKALSVVRCGGWMQNDPRDLRTQFLHDFCCHPIDMVCHVGGEIDEVYTASTAPDSYAITVRFASGAVGSLLLSCRADWGRPVDRTEILGAPGHIIEIEDQIFMRYHVGTAPRASHDPRFCTAGSDSMEETGFIPEMRAFVEHCAGTRPPERIPSRIEESARSLAVFEAIQRSAASRRPERPARFDGASRAIGA